MDKVIGSTIRKMPVGVLSLVLVVALVAWPARGAELPPAIQADSHLMQADRQIGAGDHAAALASLDAILALQAEHDLAIPDAFWFKHAQVSQEVGLHDRAVESVTRYLGTVGQGGEHSLAAVELLVTEAAAAEAAYRSLREGLASAPAGDGVLFADALRAGGYGPAMVTIPAGGFRMGCLSDDGDCRGDEQPVHEVTIAQAFALSVYELTFAEWDACVAAGGCGGYRPGDLYGYRQADDTGWLGNGSRPVVNVSWDDARGYAEWLSAQTGAEYRLPSESEWEYGARAGTTTRYSWGDEIGRNRANCDGCGGHWADDRLARAAPVGSFAANAFGLHDMHGNVEEWVADCWNNSYAGAPADGSAWLMGDCSGRVLRGGSQMSNPGELRAAFRVAGHSTGLRDSQLGFRVARMLTP